MSTAPTPSPRNHSLTCAAFLIAFAAVGGSLFLSMALKLKACPLCFYQRTFAMGVFAVLGVGLLSKAKDTAILPLLVLPMSAGALAVAAFHVYLETSGQLECPKGMFGIGTAPQQSLAILGLLFVIVVVDAATMSQGTVSVIALATTTMFGVVLAMSCILSAPPLPAPKPTSDPLDICRPPYHAAE